MRGTIALIMCLQPDPSLNPSSFDARPQRSLAEYRFYELRQIMTDFGTAYGTINDGLL